MRRQFHLLTRLSTWTLVGLLLGPVSVLAAGFGTPTIDGSLIGDGAYYGAAEATDPVDPPQGAAPFDMGSLYVCNDNDYWYFLYTINADISGGNNYGKYLLFIDTTNDANGGTSDPWGRNIVVNDPHKAEYSVRTWVDVTPYGTGNTQFWEWDGAVWSQNGAADDAALMTATTSGIEWKIARSRLGDPATIWCEVVSTGGGTGDNAQDTSNDPADDWNATDWVTTADIDNSTEVARSAGSDIIPPVLVGGCVNELDDTKIDLLFNEKVDETTAETTGNYAVTGGKTVTAAVLGTDSLTVQLTLDTAYGFGACQQVRVTGVKDLANNTIVDNGTTNVANFYRFRINMNGLMSLYLASNGSAPDTFALEGSLTPLTWDPTCDDLLADPDVDSVYTADIDFCLPCSTAASGAEVTDLNYKFTHNCVTWESGGNHYYQIDVGVQPDGIDTLNIWWNDEAPIDFTDKDIDVVCFIRSAATDPPFLATDSLGINGSGAPLTWDVPPVNFLADDGVLPDSSAGDGIFTTRLTFPTGTFKTVEFKYLLKSLADTAFAYECQGMGNRNVYLNDELFSTTVPIVLDLQYFDDCLGQTGVEELIAGGLRFALEPNRPNPVHSSTVISYAIPGETHVKLDVYDVRGRHVRTLVDEVRPEGRHSVVWNGRTQQGRPLPAGVYFYRLQAADEVLSRKILLMR